MSRQSPPPTGPDGPWPAPGGRPQGHPQAHNQGSGRSAESTSGQATGQPGQPQAGQPLRQPRHSAPSPAPGGPAHAAPTLPPLTPVAPRDQQRAAEPGAERSPNGQPGAPTRQYGPQPSANRQGPSRPAPEHPTTLIPKIDETTYIPRVEDFGAVSQGHTPDGFPTTDPDEYQPRHGSFTEPPATPGPSTGRVTPPAPAIGQPVNGQPVNGRTNGAVPGGLANGAVNGSANGMGNGFGNGATTAFGPDIGSRLGGFTNPDNERTEYFGTDLTSQFAQDFGADPGTEPGFEPAFRPGYDGPDDNLTDGYGAADSFADRPPVDPPKERGRTALRSMGEVFITAGMVVLLFVVYELYVTDIFSAQKQASATTALDKEWDTVGAGAARSNHYNLADGSGIAKLFIPSFGQDYVFTVIEGTTQNDLAIGPGHYAGSALPGQPGDFAIAGHRVGEGAPFDDLGLLQSCDSILIETQTDWFVYRMLPTADETAGWATGKGKTALCSGPDGETKVQPLTGLYSQTVGQEIVLPSEGDVVAPIPHHLGATVPANQEVKLLTLTTCNPKFSAAQRLIIHAVLVGDWTKDPHNPNKMPPEMKETS